MVAVDFPFRLHVSNYEGKTVEGLIGSVTEPDPRLLNGVTVEATFAARNPDLLPRLRQLKIPYSVDPQTIRFANDGFTRNNALRALAYAPAAAVKTPPGPEFDDVIRGALEFASVHEVDEYLLPALPYYRPNLPEARAYEATQRHGFDLVGKAVPSRPVWAYVAPSSSVLNSPYAVFQRLLDRPFAGVYVQPLRLHPRQDSVERLVRYTQFLLEGRSVRLPVIAGRVGTFGLVLMSLGIDALDSGLGERETFDLTALDRERPESADVKRSGGRPKFIYLRELMASVPFNVAELLLRHPSLRTAFACEEGECRYGGIEAQLDRPRPHFFHTRPAELEELRVRPTVELRVQLVGERLRRAIELGDRANRTLRDDGQPSLQLDFLRTWSSVLTRVAATIAGRAEQ
jgi:hypothetical protein